jgi:hypothetical protein
MHNGKHINGSYSFVSDDNNSLRDANEARASKSERTTVPEFKAAKQATLMDFQAVSTVPPHQRPTIPEMWKVKAGHNAR